MSPSQLTANRANAQHSTGPTSEAGKHAVSQNSLRHGLSGRTHAALPGEHEAYQRHCQSIIEALAPVGVIETALAQDIAASRWRLARAHAMENALFAKLAEAGSGFDYAENQAAAWTDPATGLQRIALYANRIQRAIEHSSAKLEAMQAERKAAYAQAQEEAILLTQLAQSKGETYNPTPDFPATSNRAGFVYSAPEIARLISRRVRLEEARNRSTAAAA
jgi:hypothetical protein